MAPRAAVGVAALLLLAGAWVPATAGAQWSGSAASPREEERAMIVAQVGAVHRLTVRPAPAASPRPGVAVRRAEVEVASNAGCVLVARGTGNSLVRLSIDGGSPSVVRAGERLVLRTLPRGVHRLALSAEGGTAGAGELPVTLELADPVEAMPGGPSVSAGGE